MQKRPAAPLALVSILLMASCSGGAGDNATGNSVEPTAATPSANASGNSATPTVTRARLALLPDGVEVIAPNGQRTPFTFGTPVGAAVAELNGTAGAPTDDGVNSDCGAGPTRIVRWSNGLRILAQNDRLQGWEVDSAGLYALGDLQVGMTRAALEANRANFEQTTLGTEWTVGEGEQSVGGLVGEDGRVSAMWAGLTCHFR